MTISARNWAWDLTERVGPAGYQDLSYAEKLVLLRLAESENAEKGCAYPTIATIALTTRLKPRTVNKVLAAIEESELIVRRQNLRSEDGRWPRNTYVLNVPQHYRDTDKEWIQWNTAF